jgi:hypothetical protein
MAGRFRATRIRWAFEKVDCTSLQNDQDNALLFQKPLHQNQKSMPIINLMRQQAF